MRGSLGGLPLRAALTRGAVVTAANWPLVLIQFAVVSIHRLAVSVPVVGGAFVVAVVAGGDVRTLLDQDVRAAAGLVAAALADRPEALVTFIIAVALVAVGAASVVFLVQAGTASLLVSGERQAAAMQPVPLRPSILREARAFGIADFLAGTRRFGRRFLLLGVWLYLSYAVIGLLALGGLRAALSVSRGESWEVAWGLGAILIASTTLIAVAVLNLVYALLQVVMATDDCQLGQAVRRLLAFVRHDARQVVGVFAVVVGLVLITWAASLLAAAGLALVAWVPIVGLAVVPLQVAAWLVRGVVFHYMELGAWAAYQTQYRRYGDPA